MCGQFTICWIVEVVSLHRGEVHTVSVGYWCKFYMDGEPYRGRLLEIKETAIQKMLLVILVKE